MDRYLLLTLIFCYLYIPWTNCGPLGISHRKLLQDPIPSDHDDGHLTDADVSHTGNDRPAGSGARTGHDHVAVGQDQTDQSLPHLSASVGNGAVDTVHSSDGQLVAHEGHHSNVGFNDAGQDPDHAGQGLDGTLVGHSDLADDHGSAGQDHDGTLVGHQDLTDDHGSTGQTHDDSLVDHQDSADHGHVDHNTLGDASAVRSTGSVIHRVDSASDGASVSRDHSSAVGSQHSASGGHFSAAVDQDSLVGHRSAVINHGDVHTLDDSASDHNSVSDSLINAQSNVNADSMSGSLDTSGQSQSAISDHDSSLHHGSVVDSGHGVIDPADNAIGTHNIAVASHQSATLDTHQNSVVHQDNIVSDLIDDSAQNDSDDDDDVDVDDDDDYEDADDYVIPDSVVNVQQNTLDGDNDRAVPVHSDAVAGHESLGPHNTGDLIASHNSNNDSDVLASQAHSDDGNKENSGSITSRVSPAPVHSENHLDGSGSSQTGQTSDAEGHVNAQSAHEIGGDSGLPIDLDISHLSGHEHIDGHGGHVSDHNPDMTGHVDANLNPGAGVHVPDSGAENEGSGGQANAGDNNGTEHGNSSGDHELIPSHSLPPSHEGHEVHADVVQGSGDGPMIDKDGGVHDLSHHENPEPEHIPTGGPRHSPEFTVTSSTPSGATTQVKVVILPTPAQPEPVGGEGITHRVPGGDEVEGSGSEGHLPIIPTTPNGGHEGQGHGNEGHLVALTTTSHGNHEAEGSGSGSQGHVEGHEGEGPLPGEGSGDEHEGHEGSGSGSGDKPPKDQTKEVELKLSTILLPSEAQGLQSSTDVFILPTLANSIAGFFTEKGPASLQITETPIPQSKIVTVDSSERILTNSESAEVHSSYTPALEFGISSLLSPFAADSSIPHSTSSHFPSHSTMTTEPSAYTETILVNKLSTPPFSRTSNVIRTSAIILENSSKFYFQSSSNPGITDVSITMKPSPFSETIYPTEVLRETKSRTDNLETISNNLRTPTLNSATVSPSFSSDISTDSSEVSEIDEHSATSDTLIRRMSELISESTSVKEMVSTSRTQSVLSSVISSEATSAVLQYTTASEPVLSTRPKSSVTSPISTSTSLGTFRSSTRTWFTPSVASNSSRNVSQRAESSSVGPFSSLSSNRTLGILNASTTVAASSRGSTTVFLSIFTSSRTTSPIVSTPNGSLPVPGASGASSPVSVSSKTTRLPLITTLLSTTKRKNISFNTSFPTSTTTSKKPTSPASKVEKPETLPVVFSTSRSRTGIISTRTSRGAVTERTTLSPIHAVKSTTRPESSTAPPVFVQVDLRMTWSEFCSDKSYFIADLREIIHTEKQVLVEEERFIINFPSENCRMANYLQEESLMSTQIQIQVYIIDNKGRVDIGLTIDLSVVIEKGFKSLTSRFKDKVVGARLFGQPQATSPPRLNSPGRNVQKSPGITMVTVIASVGGACCVILIILQVMIRRRILQKKLRPFVVGQRASLQSMDHVALGVIPKSRPDSGYWNPALEQEEIPEPSPHSHLVNFAGLANFSLNKNGIYEEFQMIPFETPDKCEVPVGVEEKNRFANVLPFKATRVRLQKKEGEDNSEYINANFIKGYKKADDVYIATQSPMMNTAEDFWRMVWEKQSRVILMLNPLSDTGKPKMCTMYWPDGEGSECVKQFGDYAVTLKKKDIQTDYIESTLQLRDMERNLKREIHHFWFTTWPETGLPEPLAFVKFVLDARPRYEDTGTPVVVHCGPGTGRTGVLITVDVCMRMFEEKRRVDVLQCVHQMRKERAGTVQTRDQYALIYQALNEYAVILSSPSMSTRSSVITLHAML